MNEVGKMKELARIEMVKSQEEAAMYRAKADACDYLPGKQTWMQMAKLCDKQAFIWECASL